MSDFFNPPADPVDGTPYTFGNITWQYDATSGVWNIVDASLVGERGPQGDIGPTGNTGNTGATGDPSAGDGGALTVSNGFITSRLGGFGVTGVVGVTGRFGVQGGIISLMPASTGESGIASFDSEFFNVTSTGHVSLRGDINIGGDTVVAGVAIGTSAAGDNLVVNNLGVTSFNGLTGAITTTLRAGGGITITGTNFTDQTIINRGVTSFNGLTGAVNGLVTINSISPAISNNFNISITGDGKAIIGQEGVGFADQNIVITGRLATTGATGVASFNNNFFSVQNGAVSLTGPYAVVGVTGIGFGNDVGLTGKINLTAADASMTITRVGNEIRFASNAVGGGGGITASAQQVVFADGSGGGTGSSNFVFNGTSATFGGANTQFTITGPTFNIGNNTVVRGGIFYDAAESAPYKPLNNGSVTIRANEGSVQRVFIDPQTAPTYTVEFPSGDDGWTTVEGVAESVVVILQCANAKTGAFASEILTAAPKPTLGGVAGGVDVFTLMRIKHPSGTIKMAFPIARGMTSSGVSIN